MNARIAAITLLCSTAALAQQQFKVSPEVGNSNFSAVFDAPFGERINAVSSQVDCDVTVDAKGTLVSGNCRVPLTSVMVDNEPTKTDHFTQWATNKKSDAKDCALEAKFDRVKLDKALESGKPSAFAADVPFTVCGRTREDGKKERVTGQAMLVPGAATPTIRVRAHIEKFNREAYLIGPGHTAGWLSRVQQLAPVVAEEGTIDLSLFAKQAKPETAANTK